MSVAVIRSDGALYALAEEWHDLFRRCPEATPFQSPSWLLPWWYVFGTGRPVVATLRDSGRLAGVLPLYILDDKVLPIGAGITDYQDVLLEPGQPVDAASDLLAAALCDAGVVRCDLIDLPPGAMLLRAASPSGWTAADYRSDPCPVLTLGRVPAGKRRDLRQYGHRADRIGGFATHIATPDTIETILPALLALHEDRHPGRDARLRRFHELAAPALLRDGLLRVHVLELRDRLAAGYYTLLARDRILFYLSGFDPAFARESPGTLLMGEIIAQAAAENRGELHFLRGNEPYKYAWGAEDRFNTGRSLTRS